MSSIFIKLALLRGDANSKIVEIQELSATSGDFSSSGGYNSMQQNLLRFAGFSWYSQLYAGHDI
jgi:hypothetical protein